MLTLNPVPIEGFHATINEVIEAQVINLLVIKNGSILDAIELVTAYNFKFSSAFLLILSSAMMIGPQPIFVQRNLFLK